MVVEEWLPSALLGCLSLCRYGKPYLRGVTIRSSKPDLESEDLQNWDFGAVQLESGVDLALAACRGEEAPLAPLRL